MILMTGTELAHAIREGIAVEIKERKLKLKLSVILASEDTASKKYVLLKEAACAKAGIGFDLHVIPANYTQTETLRLISKLNKDKKVTGILLQLPVRDGLDAKELLNTIKPEKDVDGLTYINQGKLAAGEEALYPATPEGVINLLRYYGVEMTGKNTLVIGKSNLVGKPLAEMLLAEGATVTVAHSRTKNLANLSKKADIICSAVGKPKLITGDMVKKGAVVVDIGTSSYRNKLVGDIDFKTVSEKAGMITPVPGGVGPMTVAMLISNILKANNLR